ncbi:hypothetical protein G6F23_014648 [Rhizopus arrhizus]|nr:hypothetical protein G6F23_014648 [Rhizopus arrhizus]
MVLDVALGERDGLDVLKTVRADYPALGVVMLSVYPETQLRPRRTAGRPGQRRRRQDVRHPRRGRTAGPDRPPGQLAPAARAAVQPRIPGVATAGGRPFGIGHRRTAGAVGQHHFHLP